MAIKHTAECDRCKVEERCWESSLPSGWHRWRRVQPAILVFVADDLVLCPTCVKSLQGWAASKPNEEKAR